MNGSGQNLLDINLSLLSGGTLVLYTTAPTFTGAGVQPTDTDYATVSMSEIASATAEDGDVAETRQISNGLDAAIFGSAGAATGYTIVGVGILNGTDMSKWVSHNQVIAAGEIPRIPLNELTVIAS